MIRDNILISSYCKILLLIILSCSLYACGKAVDMVTESSVVKEDEKVDSDIELTHKALFERSKRGVDFTQQSTEDLKVFYGCGDYVPDFNLHGRWQIIEFASEKLRRDNFVNNFPYFEINMIKNYLVGSDGCNHVSADIDVQYKTISFGLFLSTKMVCGNLQQGPQMISFLESQKFNYSFDDENRINLLKDGEVVMVLQSING